MNEVGQLSDKKTLINAGQEFQKHTLRAMGALRAPRTRAPPAVAHSPPSTELRPRDDALTHMLARFYFEVAGIDWFTRKLAGAIFGKVPEASYTDALKLFQEAEEYNVRGGARAQSVARRASNVRVCWVFGSRGG